MEAGEEFAGAWFFGGGEEAGGGAFFYHHAVFHEDTFGGHLACEGHFVGDN